VKKVLLGHPIGGEGL